MPVDYRALAKQFAAQQGWANPDIFVNQIAAESGFNPNAGSPAGAMGIAQIVPKYHPDAPAASDPVGQLKWAAAYMAGLIKKYGSYEKALSVYNSGRPDAYRDPNFAKGETYNYVKKIMGGAVAVDKRRAALGQPVAPASASPSFQTPQPRTDLLNFVMTNGQRLAQGQSPLSVLSFMDPPQGDVQGARPVRQGPSALTAGSAAPARKAAPSASGMSPEFQSALEQLQQATGVTIGSGFRSVDEQRKLFNDAVKKYGSVAAARKWVAPPGNSNHNKGLAADLRGTPEQIAMAHKLAGQYGLVFPLSNEPWHIEPIGIR